MNRQDNFGIGFVVGMTVMFVLLFLIALPLLSNLSHDVPHSHSTPECTVREQQLKPCFYQEQDTFWIRNIKIKPNNSTTIYVYYRTDLELYKRNLVFHSVVNDTIKDYNIPFELQSLSNIDDIELNYYPNEIVKVIPRCK